MEKIGQNENHDFFSSQPGVCLWRKSDLCALLIFLRTQQSAFKGKSMKFTFLDLNLMSFSIPKIKVFKNNFIGNNNLPLKRDGEKVYF